MPRLPFLPAGALRLFGRIDRFTCECPACGQITHAHFDREVAKVRRKLVRPKQQGRPDPGMTYNPLTSRLRCPQCMRIWGVGLLLYPVVPRAAASQPYDQRPTWKQLLNLRQIHTGFLLEKKVRGSDSLNVVVEQTCTCEEIEGAIRTRPNCPVHGWEEQTRARGEGEPP